MTSAVLTNPYFTTKEAAAYTHSSAKTLRRAELSGELKAYRPGRIKLYRITDLDSWVKSKAVEAIVCETFVHPKLSEVFGKADATLAIS